MSVSTGRNQLVSAMKKLRLHWENTTDLWQDPVAKAFIKDYWEPLEGNVAAALIAMERLDHLLHQIHGDCI